MRDDDYYICLEYMNINKDYGSEPLISFIITTHNLTATQVKDCVDSITALSLRPAEREIIVVDDGSDHSIMSGLMAVGDDIVYIRQRNQGQSVARNTGLRMAVGQNIQFVDGSDRLIAEGYEHCIDIVRYNDPDIVLFDYTDKESAKSTYYIPEPVDGSIYMRHNNLHAMAWGYVFSRRILLDLRFTPGRLHDDEEFTPQLFLRAERVYSTNIPAYMCRHKRITATPASDKRGIVKRLNDMEQVIVHLRDVSSSLPQMDSQALGRRVAQLTLDYIFYIMRLTHSSDQLEERLARLEKLGLFPLPDKDYTKKYMLFRKLTNHKITRKMLSLVLR